MTVVMGPVAVGAQYNAFEELCKRCERRGSELLAALVPCWPGSAARAGMSRVRAFIEATRRNKDELTLLQCR